MFIRARRQAPWGEKAKLYNEYLRDSRLKINRNPAATKAVLIRHPDRDFIFQGAAVLAYNECSRSKFLPGTATLGAKTV
jgi:hypothetical protein